MAVQINSSIRSYLQSLVTPIVTYILTPIVCIGYISFGLSLSAFIGMIVMSALLVHSVCRAEGGK